MRMTFLECTLSLLLQIFYVIVAVFAICSYNENRDINKKTDPLLTKSLQNAFPNFPWIQYYSDRSITELEIRHAVLNDLNSETARRALFFIKEDSKHMSSCDNPKLDLLKKEIRLLTHDISLHVYQQESQMAETLYQNLLKLLNKDFPLQYALLFA